ncbi:hypothetical protein MPNT_110009 [Candidatus Methylacidithermus pantelleriae]|uniref:Uncharacterized protein n=1 Tax=Candidatus Methylacidithermus pantelleriae TaxID=2744239 RepID=A0A8J2BMB3_9BACT|nr:hypothetical protein MPNT_110009 [Candidatus Methylacidithermus pantelleriae]
MAQVRNARAGITAFDQEMPQVASPQTSVCTPLSLNDAQPFWAEGFRTTQWRNDADDG